jgi:hypothetical protein
MKMRMTGCGTTLVLAVSLALFSGVAAAASLPIGTETIGFITGGTATGSFVFNTVTNQLTSWNFQLTAGGVFGSTSYNSADASAAPTGIILSNFNKDQVFSFEENHVSTRDEFDIVVVCGGVANCLTQASVGMSFMVASGPTPCPPSGQPGFCIESGEQLNVPESLQQRLLAPGFLNVTDPPGTLAFNVDITATGPIFGTVAPEPESLLLCATGVLLTGIALRRKSKVH